MEAWQAEKSLIRSFPQKFLSINNRDRKEKTLLILMGLQILLSTWG